MKYLILVLLILFTSLPAFAIQDSLDRAPATQTQLQNAQGEPLTNVLVDKQVLVVADVTNGQDREQPFVYIVQIQDKDGIVVSLGWIEGSLSANQRLSPALSWTPQNPGVYSATVFVWEAISNPSALSHTLELEIDVKLAQT